jgi:hypothetical protein
MTLQFLPEYGGQTIDELIAARVHYRVDSLVLACEQALQAKPEDSLSDAERVVLAIEALEREVNNGGFAQFFENAPEYMPVIRLALQQIGCRRLAEITGTALSLLDRVDLYDREAIGGALAAPSNERLAGLEACDAEFFACEESPEERLFDFITQHRAEISIP